MENVQEPILAEESKQTNNDGQQEDVQSPDIPLQQEEETQDNLDVQEDSSVQHEINEQEEEEKIIVEESEEIEISDDFFDHLNREEVVETLEEIVAEEDVVKIKKQVSLLKIRFLQLNKENREEKMQSFLAEGGNKEDYDNSADEWEERFNAAFEHYKANKAKYTENLEQIKIVNLEKKHELLEKLKLLTESSTDSLKQIYDQFKEIQITWKEIGAVPQANVTELWQNYHFYVERFFDKVKINRELRDLDLKKNLETKLAICEKTEALLLESSMIRSFKLIRQYHQEWKESGPVEEDKKEELWNRFKTASDKINQNRKEYYEQLDKQQEDNYKGKLILCDKMEEFANMEFTAISKMNEISEEAKRLFDAWKSLGSAPKEVHNEVWDRFRKALDAFFANRKQYLLKFKEEKVNNYNLKVNLCIQAEAIALRKDWKQATNDLLALQKEWKNIGYIPVGQSETLWKRFRKACDEFFAAKNEYFGDVQKHEEENLQKKEDLIKRVSEYVFGESREENFEMLKTFQREWTAIGYTAVSEKERLWSAFRSAIDKRFDDLKTLPVSELDKAKYTEHVSGMLDRNVKMGNETLAKEQRNLQYKIKQLTDEVNLWENNLGFFANSKNSEELKAQFSKKIEQARQEINTMQSKLAIIRESMGNVDIESNNRGDRGNRNNDNRKKRNDRR